MSLITDIRDDLLGLIGVEDPSHVSPATLARILADINATGQHLFTHGPTEWWSMRDGAALIKAPTAIAGYTLTAGATTITGGAGLATWMHGCTVQLEGETTQNRILLTAAGTYALLIPYQGTTGTRAGTVYNDAINLADSKISVRRPVEIPEQYELVPLDNQASLRIPSWRQTDYGEGGSPGYPVSSGNRSIGTPMGYLIEQSDNYDLTVTERIRLHPMPDRAYPLTWRQKNAFSKVTSLTSDNRTHICPHDYHESIFLPLVRARFSGWPHFTGDKQTLATDAATAMSLLAKLAGDKQAHRDVVASLEGGW